MPRRNTSDRGTTGVPMLDAIDGEVHEHRITGVTASVSDPEV